MGTSLDGIDLGFRAMLLTQPWVRDPAVDPIPYRDDICNAYLARGQPGAQPLKIGIVWNDGMVEPHPPIRLGLRLLADAVKKAGHKVSFGARYCELGCSTTLTAESSSSTGTRRMSWKAVPST